MRKEYYLETDITPKMGKRKAADIMPAAFQFYSSNPVGD
jgi:hypothetical protein